MSPCKLMIPTVDVLCPLPFSKTFCYEVPKGMVLSPGQIVKGPWGKAEKMGVVWYESLGEPLSAVVSLKQISMVYEEFPPLSLNFCRYLSWVAQYTMSPMGMILKMVLPSSDVFDGKIKSRLKIPPHLFTMDTCPERVFSQAQTEAIDLVAKRIDEKSFSPILLDGVTGSGKTEVFLEAAFEALKNGGQVLFLLPEISLSPQLVERFEKRFGLKPALWHSDLTPAQRRETWKGVTTGSIQAVIGARSALFLPFLNLKFMVVDEEHSHSYKQEQGVIYQARDMAIVRAKFENFPIVLASATPSLETWRNVQTKRYELCQIHERFEGATLPTVKLVDRRQEPKGQGQSLWIASTVIQVMQQAFDNHEQVLLFLNRRGYAPLTLCGSCGHRLACQNCSSWLIYHKKRDVLTCHHCGHLQKIPETCDVCQTESSFVPCGPGVERLYEEVQKLFPQQQALVMASDTIASPKQLQEALGRIHSGDVSLIIGTQMMAKGHHFPNLTVVGVIDADMSLMGGDLRAAEKTFQLLHQVGGRAGRGQKPGSVYLQTYAPDHPVYDALCRHDRDQFMLLESEQRQMGQSPPFTRLGALIVSSENESALQAFCAQLGHAIIATPQVQVLGPAPAPLYKRLKKFRYRFLIESSRTFDLQKYLRAWLDKIPISKTIQITIDIDPYTFL